MRHVVLVAAVVLLMTAGASGAAADSGSDAAFLDWLAQQPADPLPGVGTPEPVPMACSVSRDCGDGNTVGCTGNYSCVYSYRGVRCDNGSEIACPNFCQITFPSCCGGGISCSSTSGDCHYIDDGVSCNGYDARCYPPPPWGCGPPPQ